ncbi:hypothetical protein KCU71_g2699, partial [Aureobasidium melanogenum]
MDNETFLAKKFDELSVKAQTAVEWIEQHHNEDIIEIGQCNCRRAGDKTAYAWIQKLPDAIEVGCESKSHWWKDIVLVEQLDHIGPRVKDRTAMKHLKSTIQWWKIHRIALSIEPYDDSSVAPALETTIVDIPASNTPNTESETSQFAITSGSHSKQRSIHSTQVNVATLVQVATIAYRVNYLGGGYFEGKIKKAWQEQNPIPLVEAMIPFIDLMPGFKWFTEWLYAHGGDPTFVSLLLEVLKQTFASTVLKAEDPSSKHSSVDPGTTVVASPKNVTTASSGAHVGSSLTVTDKKFQAAREAFNKRMFDKSGKKSGLGEMGC